MTREEAIYNLKALLTMCDFRDAYGDSVCVDSYYEAVDMAVESLKNSERTEKFSQNVPNDDLISRKAAIDELRRDIRLTFISSVVEMLVVRVENLPAVQTEPIEQIKWERDIAIQQLKDLGYGLGEKPRTDGDLISRKAAIDALKEYFSDEDRTDTEYGAYWHHKHVLDVLEKLPSVQPAQEEIIRCKECSKRPYCKMSTAWAVVPDDEWFCGDAERSEE